MLYKYNFYTEYNQFYIEDKGNVGNTASPDFWSDAAFQERLAIENGILGVGTRCYGDVRGEIEIMDKPVSIVNNENYDHIVEAGINIHSGELQIRDCPGSGIVLSINLTPGKYRARIYGSNFSSVAETDLANDSDNDYYRIEIWPDENMERKVLKQYQET